MAKWNAQVSIKVRRTDDDGVVEGTEFKSFIFNSSDADVFAQGIGSRSHTIAQALTTTLDEKGYYDYE